MKTLKLTIAAALIACTFQAAKAQISVGLRIGTPPPRHVVVVREPVYQEEYVEPVYPYT
jgi:glycine cleavage system aminomethyltransferase T